MKKWYLLFIMLITALIVVACQTDDETQEQEENNDEEVVNNDDEDEIEENEEDTDLEDEKDEEESEEDDEADEEVETMYQINSANWQVEPLDEEYNSDVALVTIDDAPDGQALEMAHTLKENDVPAIFFVNGHFLQTEEEKNILTEIYEMGFHIGNHTYNHPNLSNISEEEQRQEIVELNDLVEDIIGERPVFFRAPFGVNTDTSDQIVEDEGMVKMNWTYGYDWNEDYTNKEALEEIMVEEVHPGANLLMHDREWTSEALPGIIEGIKEKGYDFVDPSTIKVP
ncbi:Peptidoglycan/xylan/chitin deacetylase, PgdA/CDA1 family [Pelagirhabdus alkalitolerans]|uniref:Peptidoglycan/xylan/chitin deacetylase, PgdA/CDA1 family n=1 Tax=Pelagirhabdus alkalitolerans TaxID=1612202 RepID=A0A1G6GZC9_9BACI|nr:polysaccharide deacetylase family protein [Pelagirhabdus alkalitolerans]SDB87264.1 Peptidoglycan/xylan/chitin deacetylase, PgdA/CDA1 family [Pelagirhabdus alkalitolerans]